MILEGNAFVEWVLPSATVRKLTDEEMSVYRAPFPTPESRRPTWRFPNELPIGGERRMCVPPWRKHTGLHISERRDAAHLRKPPRESGPRQADPFSQLWLSSAFCAM